MGDIMLSTGNFDERYSEIKKIESDGTSFFSSNELIKESVNKCRLNVIRYMIKIIITFNIVCLSIDIIGLQIKPNTITFIIECLFGLILMPIVVKQIILLLESCKVFVSLRKFRKHKREFDDAFNEKKKKKN